MISSLPSLSAVLIAGGQIVRFDKKDPIPVPKNVDMPVAYAASVLHAALAGKPVIWNAAGAGRGPPAPLRTMSVAPSLRRTISWAFETLFRGTILPN